MNRSLINVLIYSIVSCLINYKKNASDSVIIHATKMQTLWQDITDELAMLDPTAKMPESMLISRILRTLTHDEFFRFNNTWDAKPAKEQTIGRLTKLLRLLEVRIEQRSNDDDNSVTLKTSAGNKRFPDKTAYQQSKRCFV